MPGIYISYPFCNQKCSFCNFASGVGTRNTRNDYEAALLAEIRNHKWEWEPETLYFGGGTPSLMESGFLASLTRAIPSRKLNESTVECAPGTLSGEQVRHWLSCGINRVSMGVQSFQPAELRETGRRHTAETVAADVNTLRRAGLHNLNLDLIAGLPHQTETSFRRSLDWIARLDPPHVSVYLFEIDEDSRLGKELLQGGNRFGAPHIPNDDEAAVLFEIAVDRLKQLGYEQYELSNFARPGAQSRHNRKYWLLEPYIGFGLDAHSFDGTWRWSNPDTLTAYLARSTSPERTLVDRSEEHFFVGLRLLEGIRPTPEELQRYAEPIERLTADGFLLREADRLRLAPHAVLISNEIFQEFLHA